MFEPVNGYESSLKEAPVGVESVRRASTCVEIRPRTAKVQVGVSDHALKVGDGGRVKSCKGEVREAGWCTAVGRPREEEVSGASDMRNGPRKRFAFVVFSFVIVVRNCRRPQPNAKQAGASNRACCPSDKIAAGYPFLLKFIPRARLFLIHCRLSFA